MEAEHLSSDEFGESPADVAGERQLADRFEALEAEKVIQRALELEAKSANTPSMISTDQLYTIANEIGIDPAFVQQAMGEIRLAPSQRSRFSKFVLPDDLFATATIDGISKDELTAAINRWMTLREGLVAKGATPTGVEWDIDRRWRAKTRARTLSGDNRISRLAGGDIAHSVHHVGETQHVVAFESEGRAPLMLSKAIMSVGIGLAAFLLLGAVVSGDVLAGIIVAAVLSAASTALGVSLARWWARGIRGSLGRSLLGLRAQALQGSSRLMSRLRNSRRRKKNGS